MEGKPRVSRHNKYVYLYGDTRTAKVAKKNIVESLILKL